MAYELTQEQQAIYDALPEEQKTQVDELMQNIVVWEKKKAFIQASFDAYKLSVDEVPDWKQGQYQGEMGGADAMIQSLIWQIEEILVTP